MSASRMLAPSTQACETKFAHILCQNRCKVVPFECGMYSVPSMLFFGGVSPLVYLAGRFQGANTTMCLMLQEVLNAPNVYDGKSADVWAAAVHLYIMLVGWYPFTDPREPKNFSKTAHNICRGRFAFPKNLEISQDCKDLIAQMLQKNPHQRITLPDLKQTAWFQTNLSKELAVRPNIPAFNAELSLLRCLALPRYID